MNISRSHAELYVLLLAAENSGKPVTTADLLRVTGWKEATLRTYLGKGQLSDFLTVVGKDSFSATTVSRLTDIEFSKKLSQSKHRRGLGHNFKSRLARALIRKSRDNMMLALELYNRPSLENRLDGFVLLFCIAWEQLLKAELIEKNGEQSIYKANPNHARVRETISLQDCLDRVDSLQEKQRKNIERIQFFRNSAAHLLMPEIQSVVSRIFQAGVLNYVGRFEELTEQRFLETSSTGLLTLVGDVRSPTVASLQSNYGSDLGTELDVFVKGLVDEIGEEDDWHFAVPIDVNIVFAKKKDKDTLELVVSADEGVEGLMRTVVVQKTMDRKQTHPYNATQIVHEVNRRLHERYDGEILSKHLCAKDKHLGQPIFNPHCLQAILHKLKWKSSDNEFHYAMTNPEYHWYSDHAVEEIIKKVMSEQDYLANARGSLLAFRRRKVKPETRGSVRGR